MCYKFNVKVDNKNIEMFVQETSLANVNYTWILVVILIAAFIMFIKHIFIVGIALLIAMPIVYNKIDDIQKDLKENIKLWNRYVPLGLFFMVDTNAKKIFLTGAEVAFYDVKQIKFVIADQPQMTGKTKELLEKKFINANIVITTETNNYVVPIQTRQGIKELERLFKSLSLNTLLDVKLYHI